MWHGPLTGARRPAGIALWLPRRSKPRPTATIGFRPSLRQSRPHATTSGAETAECKALPPNTLAKTGFRAGVAQLAARIRPAMPERRPIEPRPQARAARHDDDDPAARGQDAPDFGKKSVRMLVDFESMDNERADHAGIRQRHLGYFGERRRGQARGRPIHDALLGRHEGEHAHGFLAENLEIGRRVADTEDRIAGAVGKTLPHNFVNDSPRDLAQGRAVEGTKVDDIDRHWGFRVPDNPLPGRKNKALIHRQDGGPGKGMTPGQSRVRRSRLLCPELIFKDERSHGGPYPPIPLPRG